MNPTSGKASSPQDKNAARSPAEPRAAIGPPRKVWAFLVGISEYSSTHLKLTYASKDAQDLFDCLRLPEYGDIPKEQTCLLLDQEATQNRIIGELRAFLKKPNLEDIVILFFSCHGEIDRVDEAREVPYILPYDVNPNDLAASAIPMREIMASISDYLAAQRVVVFADACYSGGLIARADGKKSTGSDPDLEESRRRYLKHVQSTYGSALSQAGAGVAMLSSSRAAEVSKEGALWNNGVFTHFLLRGLRGEADDGGNRDSVVTLGELFDYVARSVERETDGKQKPLCSPWGFDPNLPMAVVGGLRARQRLELADSLFDLARQLGDPLRFLAAARQYLLARQKGNHDPRLSDEAQLGAAKALALAKDADAGASLAQAATSRYPDLAGQAALYQALWYLDKDQIDQALAALQRFTQSLPAHPLVPLVQEGLGELTTRIAEKRRGLALLIGVSAIAKPQNSHPLRGPKNDVSALREALLSTGFFAEADIVVLCDEQATRVTVESCLARLGQTARYGDVLFIHFSGNEPQTDSQGNSRLLLWDTVWPDASEFVNTALAVDDLHRAVNAIKCATKVLSLDVCNGAGMRSLMQQVKALGTYQLWIAATPGQTARETSVESTSPSKFFGVYSYVLAQQLGKHSLTADNLDPLWAGVEAELPNRSRQQQRPIRLVGPLRMNRERTRLLDLLELTLYDRHLTWSVTDLEKLAEYLSTRSQPPAESVWYSIAHAAAEHAQWQLVSTALTRCPSAMKQSPAFIALRALAAGQLELAGVALAALSPQALGRTDYGCVHSTLEVLRIAPRHALVLSALPTPPTTAPNRSRPCSWTHQLAGHLQQRFLCSTTILEGVQVRQSAQQLAELVELRSQSPLLLLLLGGGNVSELLGLCGPDDDQPLVTFQRLASVVTAAQRPVVLFVDRDMLGAPPHRGILSSPFGKRFYSYNERKQQLGQLFPRSWLFTVDIPALTELLAGVSEQALTIAALQQNLNMEVLSQPSADSPQSRLGPIFGLDASVETLVKVLTQMDCNAARAVKDKCREVSGRGGAPDPDLLLNQAVAEAELGAPEQATEKLQQVLDQVGRPTTLPLRTIAAEANVRLAQILYETGSDLDGAVSCLKRASVLRSDLPQVHYFLARALRTQAERQIQSDAADAYRVYLKGGAPIGKRIEAEQFLQDLADSAVVG